MWTIILFATPLDTRGEHHDTQCGPDGLGGQVVAEVGSDSASVAVGASDLAPHDTVLGASALGRTVDESDPLAEVIASSLRVLDALQLQERSVGVLVPLASLETEMNGLGVESARSTSELLSLSNPPEKPNRIPHRLSFLWDNLQHFLGLSLSGLRL